MAPESGVMTEAAAPCVALHCGDKDKCNREEGNCYYLSHFYLTTTRMVDPRRTGVKRHLVPFGFETGQRNQGHLPRAGHGEQITVPGGLRRIAGQRTVRAMIVDEICEVGE